MSKVLDFKSAREEKVENKRREFERLMFKNFLGSYSVIDKQGSIYSIELIDISEAGCLFQVPWNPENHKKFERDSEVNLRIYFTQKSYIPSIVKIKNGNEWVDESGETFMRYGCTFDKTIHSYAALKSFIQFMYKFAEASVEDKGESQQVFFL